MKHKSTSSPAKQTSPNGDISKLNVVYAKFVRSEPFNMSLFNEYTSLKVLTYSASISMTVKMLHRFEQVECVFGYEGIIQDFAAVIAAQKVISENVLMAVKGLNDPRQDFLLGKVAEGSAKFYVVKDAISHAKIYLLEGKGKRRVVVGSANASDRAFSGKQAETLVAFDNDDAAWEQYTQEYEAVRCGASSELTLPDLKHEGIALEDVPVLKNADNKTDGVTLYLGTDPTVSAVPVVVQRVEKLRAGYNKVIKPLVKPKRGPVQISREVVGKTVRLVKSQRDQTALDEPSWLSIDLEAQTVLLSGKTVSLETSSADVARDAELLTQYFNNFGEGFHGDVAQLQRDYFMFMSWFYVSPFICDFRNRAIVEQEYIFDFPLFAVLFGKSNCGKTRLIETLMRSMFGHHSFLNKNDLTRTNLGGLLHTYKRFPAVFDDVEKKRFDQHATDIIKDEQFILQEYPAFVLSMNASNHAFPTEIRKRCLMIYTNASLPDHTEVAKRLYGSVRAIQQNLGTALYHAYLRGVVERLSKGDELPNDILRFSSELLVQLFERHASPLPNWCRPLSVTSYQERKYENIKLELKKLYETNPSAWTIRKAEVILNVVSYEASGLRKEIPDWLLKAGNKGGNIVMDREPLEAFLGVSFGRRWLGFMRRFG